MDKERSQLELIKGTHVNMFGGNVEEYELVWTLERLLEETDLALVYRQNIMTSVKWAIQQAERVEEQQEENARLREALEFYADDKNWEETNVGLAYISNCVKPIDNDYGEKAQQALEESK